MGSINVSLLNRCLYEKIFCDISLISSENDEFPAHKLILASSSLYFNYLTNNKNNNNNNDICKLDIPSKSVELLLTFIYAGTTTTTTTGVFIKSVADAELAVSLGDYFLLDKLKLEAEYFFERELSFCERESSFFCDPFRLYQLSKTYRCDYLLPKIITYICSNFSTIVTRDEKKKFYQSLTFEEIEYLLKLPALRVHCELTVLKFINDWLSANEDYSNERLFRHLRFFSQPCLRCLEMGNVITCLITPNNIEVADYYRNRSSVIKEHLLASSLYKNVARLELNENSRKSMKTYVLIGGKNNELIDRIRTFSFTEHWKETNVFLPQDRQAHEVIYLEDREEVYIIGGKNSSHSALKRTLVYDLKSNLIVVKSDMKYSRSYFAAAAIKNIIYVMGGVDYQHKATGSFEYFDVTKNRWKKRSPMAIKRWGGRAASINEKIVLLGGCNEFNQLLNVVEVYDTITYQWSNLTILPIPRLLPELIIIVGARDVAELYVIGGANIINIAIPLQKFSMGLNIWYTYENVLIDRNRFAALRDNDTKLILFGGCTHYEDYSGTIDIIDIKLETQYVIRLPNPVKFFDGRMCIVTYPPPNC